MSQALIDAKRELDETKAALQGETEAKNRLEVELAACNGELAALRRETAEKGQIIRSREVTLAEMERKIQRLDAEIEARDSRIGELNTKIEALQAADPASQAEIARRITAKTAEEAEDRTKQQMKKLQLTGVAIAAAVAILVFVMLWLFGVIEIINHAWLIGSVTAAAMFAAFMLPIIQNYIEQMENKNKKAFTWIAYIVCLAIGTVIALLGMLGGAPWLVFGTTLGTALGFAAICVVLLKCVIIVSKEGDSGSKKQKVATWVFATLLGGLVMGAIVQIIGARLIGNDLGAPGYLLSVIIGLLSLGALSIIGILLGFFARMLYEVFSAMVGNITTFFKSLKKRREEGGFWLKAANFVVTLISIFVGIVVGSGYVYGDSGHFSGWFIGIGAGVGATSVFFLIEGWMIRMCATRSNKWWSIVLALLVGALWATVTAFLSFGKVYEVASARARFTEAKDKLVAAENAYLQAAEATCRMFAEDEPDPKNNTYINSIEGEGTKDIIGMKGAIDIATKATTRGELEKSLTAFSSVASQAVMCVNQDQRKVLLDAIKLYPEPDPAQLSAQIWFEEDIPGVKRHTGPAKAAMVAVAILDYLIVVLSLFALILFSGRKNGNDEEKKFGKIISIILPPAPQQPAAPPDPQAPPPPPPPLPQVVVDTSDIQGVETTDQISVFDAGGKVIGAMEVQELLGTGAAICVPHGTFIPEIGQKIEDTTK